MFIFALTVFIKALSGGASLWEDILAHYWLFR
jgi:hypothetical protein